MSVAVTASNLGAASGERTAVDRERLLTAITELCAGGGAAVRRDKAQALLGVVLNDLVAGAERDIRRRLAEKLALADWPPPALIRTLARDEIEIARPILTASPLLQDADLVALLIDTPLDHQIEIAQRPRIGPPVVETIIDQAQPAVLTVLAGNDTAEIRPEAMAKLVEASRELAALRSPLARHPRMTGDLAERLYAWVGQSLRAAIVSRFRVDAERLDKALGEAVGEAKLAAPAGAAALTAEQQEMERRLISKLNQAGQLRPSYLLRALREGKLSLFEAALSALGDYQFDSVRAAVNAEGPEGLALACVGVGVDRSVFATILELARGLNADRPSGDPARARRVFDNFAPDRAGSAAEAFRRLSLTSPPQDV
ncbi:MAG: DUF2336 domain-containing protein [Caulobacteraceae bacterium]|nr:DUF2336 domain-containing protein [Caulobacteraceae bacterium]